MVKKKGVAKNISFEDALDRLEILLRELEEGRLPLAESLELFNEGLELTRICSQRLSDAEQRLALLTADENGQLNLQEIEQLPGAAEGTKIEF